jgi:hypothetical protein
MWFLYQLEGGTVAIDARRGRPGVYFEVRFRRAHLRALGLFIGLVSLLLIACGGTGGAAGAVVAALFYYLGYRWLAIIRLRSFLRGVARSNAPTLRITDSVGRT